MLFITGVSIAFFLDLVLISKKRKTLADKILACWLFFIGVHLLLFYLYFTGKSLELSYLLGIDIPLPLLHGPFLFLYTAALTNQLSTNKKFWLLHFIPAITSWLYLIQFYVLPGDQKVFVFKNKGAGYETFMFINFAAIIISGVMYIIWSSLLLRRHRRSILNQFSYTEKINLKWLQYLIYGLTVIWLAVIWGSEELTFAAVVAFIIFIGYFGIKQVGIFSYTIHAVPTANAGITNASPGEAPGSYQIEEDKPLSKAHEREVEETPADPSTKQNEELPEFSEEESIDELNTEKRKYSKSGLTPETAENLHRELTQLMESEKLYTESELSLAELAKRLNTHPNYLSQVINEREGKNLYDYINTLRVEAFKRLISKPDNQRYTILSLAYDCGFNSKSSFNRYFKKATGQAPSLYLRNLNMQVEGIE